MPQNDAERWLAEHGDLLFRFALMRLGDRELAADCVQETLLAALKAKERFRGEASEHTWLVGILKHKIADELRKQARRKEDPLPEEDFDAREHWAQSPRPWLPEQSLAHKELAKALDECLARLPLRQKTAFMLREVAGESLEETCKILGVSATNLHVLVHRARLALRRCLEQAGMEKKR